MKFFNSSKKWRFASSSITKYILAALLSLVGVQGVLAQNPENTWTLAGSMNDWNASDPNYAFVRQDVSFADNNYTNYLDLEFPEAGSFEYKLVEAGNNLYGMTTTINNTCKWWEWKSDGGNTTFNYNAGKYRFYINANSDQRRITVTGIFVTIEEPVQNADGSYTITGRFTNANPGQQNIHTYQIVFSEGVNQGVGANETATVGEDGSFSITKQLVEGQKYTCCARAIDGSIGNHDSEYITFTAEAATEPQPEITDLYIFGPGSWTTPSDEWKYTSVSEDGNVYTWDWTAPKTINPGTYFKVGAKNAGNSGLDDNNNYGPKDNDVTLDFSNVESVLQNVVNKKDSKAFTVSAKTEISKIVFDKSALTVTFYTPVETQDPVYSATITADASVAEQVSLASTLTETAAGTDLATATCVFQYKAADAGDEAYADMSETASVIYSDEGATRTATLSQSMAAGSYVFRAVWTYSEVEVANAVTGTVAIGDAGVTYPVTPVTEHFSVEWTPVYNPADGTVTFTAQISATEDAGFVMGQITGLVAHIIVNGNSTQATVEYAAGSTENTATATVTYQNASIDDVLEYSMSLTTGSNGIVSGVGGIEIAGGSYTVIEPEAQNSTLILRGEMNSWAYDGIDDKYVGKTYDGGTTVFWDWSESPVEFAFSSGDGSTFKIDDTTDGEWGEGQWGYKASNDFWIVQDLISSDGTVTITGLENHANASSLLFDKAICPVTVSRMELNTATHTLTIDCEITVPQKDLWFRSGIVTPGWGNDITDPIGAGIDEKWQGRTSDGVVYTWDWSGSKAVTLESGTEFKFGEYKGTSWAASGYAPNGQASVTSADFGKEISVQVAAGNFSAGEKITITKITLDTETLKLVLEGEKFTERFPVTVNVVNGENGSVVTDPSDITNMAVGETVTVTATPNEGYTVVFEATSGVTMTDGTSDNVKVFTITGANPVITVTFQVQCQTFEPGFSISGQFNFGMEDADGLYQGSPISSLETETDPKDGIWSDGTRSIQLTANGVPANYFKWECVGYAIDGHAVEIVPEIAWTDKDRTSAHAELSRPGTYSFVCDAKCNLDDDWTRSDTLTITAPVPAMGFNGVGIVGSSWDHTSAGREGEGLMTRQNGSLVWKSRSFKVNGFTNADQFVIIQQYKRYGCTPNNGWNGWNECQAVIGNDWGNKINGSDLTFSYVKWENDAKGSNFLPVNPGTWAAGADGTDLQLVVTMTGHDSYTVELAEYKNITATATTEPSDGSRGTVSMAAPDGTIIPSGSNVADYVGQQVTLTATPASGYKVASWEINGKVTESDRTTISPTLSGEGLNVVVTFERDCYSGVVYDLNGGGTICENGGSTELSLNTLNNVTYQLYRNGAVYDKAVPVQGNGEAAKWTISEAGTYTAKAYDSRHEECQEQAIDMNGSAVVTTVPAPEITVNPGDNVHLTVLQARSFTAKVPVDWSIRSIPSDTGGTYCDGDGYMISSQTDTSLVAKFLCVGTAKITATMKAPNQKCMAEVTVTQNMAENENCAPEPEDMQ